MDQKTLLGFIVKALLWGLTYYYIRRGLNPEVTDLNKYTIDAIYGTLASFASAVAFHYISKNYLK